MPGFCYQQWDAPPITGIELNYVAFGGTGRQSHVRLFNLPAAAGPFSLTGFGFQPECIIIFGALHALGEQTERARLHFGVATSPTEQWHMEIAGSDNFEPAVRYGSFSSDRVLHHVLQNLTVDWVASLDSFDADGITLDIENPPSGNIPMACLALRGAGDYKCGVSTVPVAVGTQVVEVGFAPDLVFLGSNAQIADGGEGDEMSFSLGAADDVRQFSNWMGAYDSTAADPVENTASISVPGTVLTIGEAYTDLPPATPTIGVANLRVQAERVALGGDDFTLDFTIVDGVAYKYGWLAVENAATDRFTSGTAEVPIPTDADPTDCDTVTTPVAPTALLGFNTSMTAAEEADPGEEKWKAGAAIGISAADSDAADTPTPTGMTAREITASAADWDAPNFGVQQTSSDFGIGVFGCITHTKNFPYGQIDARHRCNITSLDLVEPDVGGIVSMNWRSSDRRGVADRILVGD